MPVDGPKRKERTYGGLTKAERDAHRRRRLLDAALDAFGTTGYQAASVELVCAAAGVSTRNFYDHFSGRESLLIALYDEVVAEAMKVTGEALAATGADETVGARAQAGLTAFATYMLGDERRARVNFIEVVGASHAVEAHRRAALQAFAGILREVGAQAMAAGFIAHRSDHELQIATTALVGAVQETLTDWMARDPRLPLPLVVDTLVEIIALVVGERPPAQPQA